MTFDEDDLRNAMADAFPEATAPDNAFFWGSHRHVTILFTVLLLLLWLNRYV